MISVSPTLICYHCGNDCRDAAEPITFDDKPFCCAGCQMVYEVLNDNQLCQYYALNSAPGKTASPGQASEIDRLAFLDLPDIAGQLLDFRSGTVAHVTFYIPAIHCSSCLWLLEHLYRIEPGVQQCRVDFLKKQVHLVFDPARLSLRQVAELLTSLGYEPLISLNDVVKETHKPTYRPLLYRLAIAGFCAGNIMLFSFPEYLGLDDPAFSRLFGRLNLLLATPVVFYSASGYFTSVWKSLRHHVRGRLINIDFPILLGILVAYFRGTYEVLALDGAGYFDSVSGLIFFLLCGKWFQQRTYDFLSFERDYKSYFPLAVERLGAGGVGTEGFPRSPSPTPPALCPIADLRKGDRIRVRHGDLIPADGLLYRGDGLIDYSFVTGESEPEPKEPGALLYAGGRQQGGAIDLEIVRDVSQSYLTQLWNNDAFRKDQPSRARTFADAVGTYFTLTVLTLATFIGAYWYAWAGQPTTAVNAFTAILIIACPCVLSLSYPVALGHGLRLLGKRGFFLKNAAVIEQLTYCDTIVFDKTGTLTEVGVVEERTNERDNERKDTAGSAEPAEVSRINRRKSITEAFSPGLTEMERAMIGTLVSQSAHPLSRQLTRHLANCPPMSLENFTELPGQGIVGLVNNQRLKVGSAAFTSSPGSHSPGTESETDGGLGVHISLDGTYRGQFAFSGQLREGLSDMLTDLAGQGKHLFLLSGDTDAARAALMPWFADGAMRFGCSPEDKLTFVRDLQASGHRVLMIGDGLNDAGALKQADIGIAVTDDTLHFTPASDAILQAGSLRKLAHFLQYGQFAMHLIRVSFGVSLLYNIAGLSFAATGHLSPVVAAVLMPLCSATMVLIATVGMRGRKL